MKFLKAAVLAIGFGLVSTSGALAADEPTNFQSEEIMGVSYDGQGITYQVYSGGCTAKRHFDVLLQETFPVGIRLIRKKPDLCEAYIPYGVNIQFTWEELGLTNGTKFHIANRLAIGDVVVRD